MLGSQQHADMNIFLQEVSELVAAVTVPLTISAYCYTISKSVHCLRIMSLYAPPLCTLSIAGLLPHMLAN